MLTVNPEREYHDRRLPARSWLCQLPGWPGPVLRFTHRERRHHRAPPRRTRHEDHAKKSSVLKSLCRTQDGCVGNRSGHQGKAPAHCGDSIEQKEMPARALSRCSGDRYFRRDAAYLPPSGPGQDSKAAPHLNRAERPRNCLRIGPPPGEGVGHRHLGWRGPKVQSARFLRF